MKLYRKADGEIVGTQALAGKGHTAIDVPTDKPGLIAWLNAQRDGPWYRDGEPDLRGCIVADEILATTGRMLSQDDVDRQFADPTSAPPLARDAVCESIAQYEGADLGYVALEVAGRFQTLAKRDELLS